MAVFYSISNCQKGLAGVTFGNFLIKQVAKELSRQLPELTLFRTLSPIPGFMRWANHALERLDRGAFPDADGTHLQAGLNVANKLSTSSSAEMNEFEAEQLQSVVAHYLVHEKREDHLPLDPVARFHLGNGASLDQVLAGADDSQKGLKQSASAMVSYLYDLEKVEENHEAYANDQVVKTSTDVSTLITRARRRWIKAS